jgi:hypothetical protein
MIMFKFNISYYQSWTIISMLVENYVLTYEIIDKFQDKLDHRCIVDIIIS